jgi:hypothetical protein
VPADDGNRLVHVMMRAVNVHDYAIPQAACCWVIFRVLDIAMSLVQEFAGIMQASHPRPVSVHGGVVFDVLAVVNCSALDFVNGVVNFFNSGALFGVQSATIGALQVRPRIAQVGKGVQVSGMLGLRANIQRREREQESDRRSDHCQLG